MTQMPLSFSILSIFEPGRGKLGTESLNLHNFSLRSKIGFFCRTLETPNSPTPCLLPSLLINCGIEISEEVFPIIQKLRRSVLYLVRALPNPAEWLLHCQPGFQIFIYRVPGQMDLETENRIASILLKEAAELRRQSEREGVLAYLRQPTARGRPNSRFLTATVLGVQQANRVVEVNEMWRVRQKEKELDERISIRGHRDSGTSLGSTSKTIASCSSSKRVSQSCYSREDEGLRDEEVDEFLHSRVKRGRGAVGSRMDETGPYLPLSSDSKEQLSTSHDDIRDRRRVVIGPEKPPSLKYYETSSEDDDKRKKAKKSHSCKHKHKSKEKSRDRKKERRSKTHK